jgi:hypothetical protein
MVSSRFGALTLVCILVSLAACGDEEEVVRPGADAALDVRSDVAADVPMFDVNPPEDADVPEDAITPNDTTDAADVDVSDAEVSDDTTDVSPGDVQGDGASDGEVETEDVQDDADSGPPLPMLYISEIMLSPCEASAGAGQWFELHNPGTTEMSINGLTITDGAGGSLLVVGAPPVPAGAWYVVAASADVSANGGIDPDFVFSGLDFSPDEGEMTIAAGGTEIVSIAWDASTFPDAECSSASVDPSVLGTAGALTFDNWCPGTSPYGDGDLGTPGAPNPTCVVPDTEVDWCRFQFPSDLSLTPGTNSVAFVRVFEDGITTRTTGTDADAALRVEFGIGPTGTQPSLDSWVWTAASPNASWRDAIEPGNDEYQASVVAPATAGLRDMAFRVTRNDGLVWLYCDRGVGPGADGAENGYQIANAARLNVVTPCEPNPCTTAPAATCDGASLTTWETPGACSVDGILADCSYDPVLTDCSQADLICQGGACVDPCDPNPCSSPPESGCDGNEVVTWQESGICSIADAGGIDCAYVEAERLDCAAIDQECFEEAGIVGCRTPEPPVDVDIDWCRLQFPVDFEVLPGGMVTVFGRFFSAGLTDLTVGINPAVRVLAAAGYGPDGTDPAVDTAWVWADAQANPAWNGASSGEPGNDEYQATFTAPTLQADYDLAFRFSGDAGATWTYCDRDRGAGRDGAENGYAPADAARMLVTLGRDGCLTVDDCLARAFSPFCDANFAVTAVDSVICNEDNTCEYLYEDIDCSLSDAICEAGACEQREYTVGYCKLQFPETLNVSSGTLSTVYGIVFAEGLTTRTNAVDTSPALIGQVGYGPAATVPDDAVWTWSLAIANPGWNAVAAGQPNNDEYQAGLRAPATTGTFSYAYRFSGDGGATWVYCDRGAGSSNGFQTADMGVLTVVP